MIFIGTDGGIYRWYEGSPWPVFHGLQDQSVRALASPGGGTLAAIDGSGRLWESGNNGMDWREVALPDGVDRPTALVVTGSPPSIVIATRPLGLFRAVVGADSWTSLAAPPVAGKGPSTSIRALAPSKGTPEVWFAAVAGSGLWRSQDGGGSWQECPGLPSEVYAIRAVADRVAVATSDGCWISDDGGQSWADWSGGLDGFRHLRALEIRPDEPNHLLAGAAPSEPGGGDLAPRGGLRFTLRESKDGGKTWAHVKRGFPDLLEYDTIDDIRFDPAATDFAIVSLASGELWRTRNGGDWWEPLARQIQSARILCAVG